MPHDLSPFARRLVPARADLAARHLEGRVAAARFVAGAPRRVAAPILDLTLEPDPGAERASQLLHGEPFTVYDERGGLAWGQSDEDGYVGFVPADGLKPWPEDAPADAAAATRVTALAAHVYPRPDFKAPPRASLPMLARVTVDGEDGRFVRLAGGGYLHRAHLAPVLGDVVTHAERFLGVPYLWGGRSAAGIDCSGLVQVALMAAGIASPRDSDMQERFLGDPLPEDAPLQRGDLVFWRGHIGFVGDDATLVHANIHHMAVVREPLDAAVARIAAGGGGPVTARRRLGPAPPAPGWL